MSVGLGEEPSTLVAAQCWPQLVLTVPDLQLRFIKHFIVTQTVTTDDLTQTYCVR